ncbi:protein kinase [Anaeramoeba ignava]|uniref:Protein kinase n=1 Tax=Anaeramoeba ignava TaxID=1746090 RepID=A0A9Q0LQD7_ANAIG|nr:protein kinase [Anaeramoeba ignava]
MSEYVGPYLLGKTLGVGTSGKVKLGVHKETGEKVAIKILPKTHFLNNPDLKQKVGREIAVLKLMKNPHILQNY